MRPKERAENLVKQFYDCSVNCDDLGTDRTHAKLAANICINEILESLRITTGHCELNELDSAEVNSDFNYWYSVKKEIDKL